MNHPTILPRARQHGDLLRVGLGLLAVLGHLGVVVLLAERLLRLRVHALLVGLRHAGEARRSHARCPHCDAATPVSPPENHEFVGADDEDGETREGQYTCPECGKVSRLRHHKLRRLRGASEAISAFTESYGDMADAPALDGLAAITTFDETYQR
ncbi:MAG: phage terminase large subunit family protein [Vicinamibacterales bacterium]